MASTLFVCTQRHFCLMSFLCFISSFPSRQFVEGDFEDYLSKLQDPQVRQQWNNKLVRVALPPEAALQSLLMWFYFQQWVGEVEINALAIMYKYALKIGLH